MSLDNLYPVDMASKPNDRTRDSAVFMRDARKKLGLTQADMGTFLSVTGKNISHIEAGRQGMTHAQWVKVSEKSGKPIPKPIGNQKQAKLETTEMVDVFESLPPLARDHVLEKARELQRLYAQFSDEVRGALSAPPSDPSSYTDWEKSIQELVDKLKANQNKPKK